MDSEAIAKLLRVQPFVPFEVRTTCGSRHAVPTPEMAWAPPGADLVVVCNAEGRITMIDPNHIVRCARLEEERPN